MKIVKPNEPMGYKIAKWCEDNRIYGTTLYDIDTSVSYKSGMDKNISISNDKYFGYNIKTCHYQEFINYLVENKGIDHNGLIGMSTDGEFNSSLLGDTRLARKFYTFIKRYGYTCFFVENHHYILGKSV